MTTGTLGNTKENPLSDRKKPEPRIVDSNSHSRTNSMSIEAHNRKHLNVNSETQNIELFKKIYEKKKLPKGKKYCESESFMQM